MSNFSEDDIVPLDPIEHIRRRAGLYFGSIDQHALHRLVFEVVSESIIDAVEQTCDKLEVTLHPNRSITISDNGDGIPLHHFEWLNLPMLEAVMTKLAQGGRWYNRGRYNLSNSIGSGVGMAAVSALSSELTAQVRRDGYLWQQTYSKGKTTSEIIQIRSLSSDETTGTTITFTPDFSILEPNEFSYTALAKRFRELAYLVPGLTITLKDEREQPEGSEVSFHYPNGLSEFVTHLNRDNTCIHSVIRGRGDVETNTLSGQSYPIGVDVAFQYVEQSSGFSLSYANAHESPYGGTHVEGLLQALRQYIGVHVNLSEFDEPESNGVDEVFVSQGLTAVVHVMHPYARPSFEGDMRGRLVELENRHAVYEVASEAMRKFSEQHPAEMQRLIDYLLARKQERDKRRFGE